MVRETVAGEQEQQSDSLDCPEQSAEDAGLHYVSDSMPGIQRKRSGRGYRFLGPDGVTIRGKAEIQRIKSLAIPPAWTDVWICPLPNGHLQATGRDARGRKQYRYHPDWRAVRDENKFNRMLAFGEALPRIRERTDQDLASYGLPREKVLATIVRLLDMTFVRVGNKEYARENGSFGLTTMRDRHVEISGARLQFRFRGKAGKVHTIDIRDRQLASIVKRCRDIPGYELFQYIDDDGNRQTISSEDVNDYLRHVAQGEFSAKDFRTWAGTVLASRRLREMEQARSKREAARNIVQAVREVADLLGNTPAICRRCYVHPVVIECYEDGTLHTTEQAATDNHHDLKNLREDEQIVMKILRATESA